ncbi:NUDIX hydrolase [Labrys okinawensis]|nr:NUDIX hydrolase [Labrys okinawensis]
MTLKGVARQDVAANSVTMTEAARSYPPRPILAASIALFRHGKVLLGERARAPGQGLFSLPGGVVELGETLEAAVRREVREETGLEIEITGFVRHHEVIARDGVGAVQRHFVVAVFVGRSAQGEPRLSEETLSFRWADPSTLDDLPLTDGLADIVAAARRML